MEDAIHERRHTNILVFGYFGGWYGGIDDDLGLGNNSVHWIIRCMSLKFMIEMWGRETDWESSTYMNMAANQGEPCKLKTSRKRSRARCLGRATVK